MRKDSFHHHLVVRRPDLLRRRMAGGTAGDSAVHLVVLLDLHRRRFRPLGQGSRPQADLHCHLVRLVESVSVDEE